MKLIYNKNGNLEQAVLNGKEMELFDLLNEDGSISGAVQERSVVHRRGKSAWNGSYVDCERYRGWQT